MRNIRDASVVFVVFDLCPIGQISEQIETNKKIGHDAMHRVLRYDD
jgi:hypothetical protein